MVVPSLPAYLLWQRQQHANQQAVTSHERIRSVLINSWHEFLQDPDGSIVEPQLRQVQDAIFLHRSQAALIPKFIYNRWRSKQEDEAEYSAELMAEEADERRSSET